MPGSLKSDEARADFAFDFLWTNNFAGLRIISMKKIGCPADAGQRPLLGGFNKEHYEIESPIEHRNNHQKPLRRTPSLQDAIGKPLK